jgi:hypothetical protein
MYVCETTGDEKELKKSTPSKASRSGPEIKKRKNVA